MDSSRCMDLVDAPDNTGGSIQLQQPFRGWSHFWGERAQSRGDTHLPPPEGALAEHRCSLGDLTKLGYIPTMPLGPDNEPAWTPHADVFLNSIGEFTVKVELAALHREDLDISCEGRCLFIAGRRPDADREDMDCKYMEAAISWGRFELIVEVPGDFDLTKASAKYQNGLLRVVVPPNDWRHCPPRD